MSESVCPNCDARIQNAEAGRDGLVRCLNCGKEFPATPDSASPARAVSDEPSGDSQSKESEAADAVPATHPTAGRYGMLTAFSLVGFALAVSFGFLLSYTLTTLPEAYRGPCAVYGLPFKFLTWLIVSSAFLLAGYALITLMRLPGELDRLAIKLRLGMGPLKEKIAPTPGSSLPYLLPISVPGALIGMRALMDLSEGSTSGSDFLLFPTGVLIFLAGLCAAEARRFFWRLDYIGQALLSAKGVTTQRQELDVMNPGERTPLLLITSAVFFGLALIGWVLAALFGMEPSEMLLALVPERSSVFLVGLLLGLTAVAVGYSLFLINRIALRCLETWEAVARSVSRESSDSLPPLETVMNDVVAWGAYLWAFGWVWTMVVEDWTQLFGLIAVGLLVIWVGKLLSLGLRAAEAAERIAAGMGTLQTQHSGVAGKFYASEGQRRLIWFIAAVVAIKGFGITAWELVGLGHYRSDLLGVYACWYPVLWLVMLTSHACRGTEHLASAVEQDSRGG